jgi:hypothetical protein
VFISGKVVMTEMGRACSANGSEEECIEDISGKARKRKTYTWVGG